MIDDDDLMVLILLSVPLRYFQCYYHIHDMIIQSLREETGQMAEVDDSLMTGPEDLMGLYLSGGSQRSSIHARLGKHISSRISFKPSSNLA